MTGSHLFEALKKDRKPLRTASFTKIESIQFCLLFDEQGAFIEVQNEKGQAVTVDYQDYSGAARSILKSVHSILQRSDFLID